MSPVSLAAERNPRSKSRITSQFLARLPHSAALHPHLRDRGGDVSDVRDISASKTAVVGVASAIGVPAGSAAGNAVEAVKQSGGAVLILIGESTWRTHSGGDYNPVKHGARRMIKEKA